jgi:uncharacterized membrane protein
MSWAARFRFRQSVAESLWILPLLGGVLGAILGGIDVHSEQSLHLPASLTYSSSTASTLLSAIVGSMAALAGFVVTVTVLVVQMLLGSFSARYMRLWYRDWTLKVLLGLLVGTLAFSFALLRRVESNFVPNLGVTIAGALVLLSLIGFVFFLDGYLHVLRPVAVAVLVSGYLHRNFARTEAALAAPDVFWGEFEGNGQQPSLVVRSKDAGAIQSVHVAGMARWAREHACLVASRHRIGDFVPAGATLLEVYGDGVAADSRAERRLRGMIALGQERTIDQDPPFGIRIMVDIADLALSPAVNDPTSAVQVLNHISEALRVTGAADLSGSRWTGDSNVRSGVVLPRRSWQDYLILATTEIREYGASSIQVMRRMRAMLEELHNEVRPEYRAAVQEELARLDATVASQFGDTVDLDRANVPDEQGIGGRNGHTSTPVERDSLHLHGSRS